MHIKSISIHGLRGFSTEQHLDFAIPNGNPGSGLTVLVGPNNSGKSTIAEALKAVSSKYFQSPSFSSGKRNTLSGDSVSISLINEQCDTIYLKSIKPGSSETTYEEKGFMKDDIEIFVVPSRRNFEAFFGKNEMDRTSFLQNSAITARRSTSYDNFSSRLFEVQKNPDTFNKILFKIFGKHLDWTIDLSDEGQYFIKIVSGSVNHNTDGAGEGLLSIFTIVDALYDSRKDNIIVIDEPELSLHPALQKRLYTVLSDFSEDRQIIISTHSPYFVNWRELLNGGKIARVVNHGEGTQIHQLSDSVKNKLRGLVSDLNNPHALGITANEVFFLDDNVILVEGQEDVVFYNKIVELLGIELAGDFFGWGAGGAEKMDKILALLQDLGFLKVAVILDGDKMEELKSLKQKFSNYDFHIIPTNDVRDKLETPIRLAKDGLIDKGGKRVKPEYEGQIHKIFDDIRKYVCNKDEDNASDLYQGAAAASVFETKNLDLDK